MIHEVSQYIFDNVLHSGAWDNADATARTKAVNNAEHLLKKFLPDHFKSGIPIEDLAYQALWILKLDDTLQRAEQGVTSVSMEGLTIALDDMDRSIAPIILKSKGIDPKDSRALIKRRAGSYGVVITDTHRSGIRRAR